MLHVQGNPIYLWNTRIEHLEHAPGVVPKELHAQGHEQIQQNQQNRLK